MLDVKKAGEELYYYSTIDNKFKCNLIAINLITKLNKENASKNAVLAFLLRQSSKKYPNSLTLGKALRSLYGASLFCDIATAGNRQILTFGIEVLDDFFAFNKEDLTKKAVDFLLEIIFNPKIENGSFLKADVEGEKKELKQYLNSIYADKKEFALQQALKTLFRKEDFYVGKFGDVQSLEQVDEKNLVKVYTNLISSSIVFVSCCFREEKPEILNLILKKFNNAKRNCADIITKKYYFNEFVEKKEEDFLNQAKLVVIFDKTIKQEKKTLKEQVVLKVFNCVFGGSATSMLFNNVREKLGLCYYCKSSYDEFLDIIVVESGVETKNLETAYCEILSQLENLKKGDFKEEDLDRAKCDLETAYRKISDAQGKKLGFSLDCFLKKTFATPDEIVKTIKQVKKEEVVEVAKSFSVVLKYLLKEKKEV